MVNEAGRFYDHRQDGSEMLVRCPACGSENVHHGEVSVRIRKEDADGYKVDVSRQGQCSWSPIPERSGDWSGRRGSVFVVLRCEQCQVGGELVIEQHKGQTFLKMRTDADAPKGSALGGKPTGVK